MPNQRIELCVRIPGAILMDEPLQEVEIMALGRFSPQVLDQIQSNTLRRIVDYTGNYFLVPVEKPREAV